MDPFRHRSARVQQIAGYTLVILAMAIAGLARQKGPREKLASFLAAQGMAGSDALPFLLFLVVAPAVGAWGLTLVRRARQMRATHLVPRPLTPDGFTFAQVDNQGRTVGTVDARESVLYLRSFNEDSITSESRTRGANQFLSELTTEEEQLAAAVKPVGPLVAIGKPGEPLPELGALRMYVNDDEWQAVVLHWLTHARLVILRVAGNTEGLFWELAQAPRAVAPQRLVLLIPLKRPVYERLRARAQPLFPRGLPDYRERLQDMLRRKGLMGLVYFEADWTPRYARIRPLFLTIEKRRLVKVVLMSALRPVFAQLGVQPSRWWQFWRRSVTETDAAHVPAPARHADQHRSAHPSRRS